MYVVNVRSQVKEFSERRSLRSERSLNIQLVDISRYRDIDKPIVPILAINIPADGDILSR